MTVPAKTKPAKSQITIGMPLYNNARTLRRAINSVLSQCFEDWHLIITDDQSSDNSFQIAQNLTQSDPRVTLLRNPRRLAFQNFGTSLRSAQTPYFVWLAGDDYWEVTFLEKTHAALDVSPEAVSAVTEAAFVGNPIKPIPNLGFLRGQKSERIRQYLAHPGGTRMYGLMRTDIAKQSFPKKAVHGYDWYFMVALLSQGPQLTVPECLLYREETPWFAYAKMAKDGPGQARIRQFPVLNTSLMLLQDRRCPMGAVPALVRLNLRKHEEYLAVNAPNAFKRRQPLFRLLGLPIANRPEKLNDIQHQKNTSDVSQPSTINRISTPVTAVLTCRNAQDMLPAYMAHASELGHDVVIIDHGSTDQTLEIARDYLGQTCTTIIDIPFEGYFDLSAQLELKQQVMADLTSDWVIHADVDEFLSPPAGETLNSLIQTAQKLGQIAIPVEEHLFVPQVEDEAHDPTGFRTTMSAYFLMEEHDKKQRLFQRDAPLETWFATGGHTVTRIPSLISNQHLTLDHYLGLSLDDLRGTYCSRVFAPRDTFKNWHTNRMVAQHFDVTEIPGDLCNALTPPKVKFPPVFQPAAPPIKFPLTHEDLVVICASQHDRDNIKSMLGSVFPGLRLFMADTASNVGALPMLCIASHPARIHHHQLSRSQERQKAMTWVRNIAGARQIALACAGRYAEMRIEDLQSETAHLKDKLSSLFIGLQPRGPACFMKNPATIALEPYANPVRTITKDLARDLGYL